MPAKHFWVISSVGLEHYLDRVGVTGSNPVLPTSFKNPGNGKELDESFKLIQIRAPIPFRDYYYRR